MIIANADEMLNYGRQLGSQLRVGDWVAIDGPLGVGKTVLCRGILQSFGFNGDVASPSYALIHQYLPPDVTIPLVHADLYRISSIDELDELGLSDGSYDCITLVEWAERSGGMFGVPSHHIEIDIMASGDRKLTLKTP
jgi:tRNA threonylcarbamoyladenosine biosynthesis protein TsaE